MQGKKYCFSICELEYLMREFKIMSVNKAVGRHEAWPVHTKCSRLSCFVMSVDSCVVSSLQDQELTGWRTGLTPIYPTGAAS